MQISSVRSRLLKVAMTVVVGLVVVQYWLRAMPDFRKLEPLFQLDNRTPSWTSGHDNNASETESYLSPGVYDIAELNATATDTNSSNATPICPAVPPGLVGRITAEKEEVSLSAVEAMFPTLEPGGRFRPSECRARDKVAIIVPYRDREQHLAIFLRNIHRLLMKQQIDYEVFIIEQTADAAFNRGKLMNVGFAEAKKIRDFDCFVFHDVDLIPEDDRNLYTCPEQPRHMSVAIDKMNYKLPYKDLFGGVSALTREHFELVNGFSNQFWGWGGEDDDVSYRIRHAGLHISRYPPYVARYAMLTHQKATPNKNRYKVMQMSRKQHAQDGLNSLSYLRKDFQLKKLYTWILVDLQPPS